MKTPVTCLIASALRLVRFFAERAFCRYPFHSGKTPPGGLPPSQTPQFIVLTFDDAVTAKTFPDYLHLFQQTKYKLKRLSISKHPRFFQKSQRLPDQSHVLHLARVDQLRFGPMDFRPGNGVGVELHLACFSGGRRFGQMVE